ncbi:uncharacterized protein FPRN_15250 [Fusarium proliferatum]|nr:uncharacterized protein FPRN_15250 [Fusarium proliferatum]
MHSTGIGLPS